MGVGGGVPCPEGYCTNPGKGDPSIEAFAKPVDSEVSPSQYLLFPRRDCRTGCIPPCAWRWQKGSNPTEKPAHRF